MSTKTQELETINLITDVATWILKGAGLKKYPDHVRIDFQNIEVHSHLSRPAPPASSCEASGAEERAEEYALSFNHQFSHQSADSIEMCRRDFLAGYCAAQTEIAEKQLRGWIIWHPKLGFEIDILKDNEHSAQYKLSQEDREKGWSVQPVKLILTSKKL